MRVSGSELPSHHLTPSSHSLFAGRVREWRDHASRLTEHHQPAVPVSPGAGAQQRGAYLSRLTWPEAEQALWGAPMVIVPFDAGAKDTAGTFP